MSDNQNKHESRARRAATAQRLRFFAIRRPLLSAALMLGCGVAIGAGGLGVAGIDEAKADPGAELEQLRKQSQLEANALAARLAELQAQANRLNALGERLIRKGELEEGEFDFDAPVGQGGAGRGHDIAPTELKARLAELETRYRDTETQLGVIESLLLDRQLHEAALPSRAPLANSYITSSFGGRADPFGQGEQFHKGIDYAARTGDPVLAVADGVVTFSASRSGYGNTIEIDHGNGYVTRYAHNSALSRGVGELVRAGDQIALAGSTGRSTGPHVHLEVWQDGVAIDPMRFLRPTRQ